MNKNKIIGWIKSPYSLHTFLIILWTIICIFGKADITIKIFGYVLLFYFVIDFYKSKTEVHTILEELKQIEIRMGWRNKNGELKESKRELAEGWYKTMGLLR